MRDEIKSIVENLTWDLDFTPSNETNVIQGRWVFRTKTDAKGQITKFKSRWVVRGIQQEEGCNHTDTYACAVKPISYKTLFSLLAAHNLKIEQMDVKTAFLKSPFQEDVYVEQPHGFEVKSIKNGTNLYQQTMNTTQQNARKQDHQYHEIPAYPKSKGNNVNLVCKLNKVPYGLKQAPKLGMRRYGHLCKRLILHNLNAIMRFSLTTIEEYLSLHTSMTSSSLEKTNLKIQHLKSQLNHRFQMSDLGPVHM